MEDFKECRICGKKLYKEYLLEIHINRCKFYVCYGCAIKTWNFLKPKEDHWYLANQEYTRDELNIGSWCKIIDVKKCRDLILKDIYDGLPKEPTYVLRYIEKIINKRFGDLK